MSKLTNWLYDNTPLIMRRKKYIADIDLAVSVTNKKTQEIDLMFMRCMIGPVLSDLKELKNNTWDLERLDRIYAWLESWKEQQSEDYEVSQSENKND